MLSKKTRRNGMRERTSLRMICTISTKSESKRVQSWAAGKIQGRTGATILFYLLLLLVPVAVLIAMVLLPRGK